MNNRSSRKSQAARPRLSGIRFRRAAASGGANRHALQRVGKLAWGFDGGEGAAVGGHWGVQALGFAASSQRR